MASQQILTIPINQATSNQMIQMVAPNGQVYTSSVANLQAMSSVQQMGKQMFLFRRNRVPTAQLFLFPGFKRHVLPA